MTRSERSNGKGMAIRLVACSKTFPDGTRALEPLDLEILGGETLVFLGPSGCGKTTTLRLIAGLESPDPGGRIIFDQDDVTALPIERRNVGMVFQSYALFPNMNVWENVAYGPKVRRLPEREVRTRVAEMLEMMQIGELRDRRIGQLSGGQRQRVALARAIAVRPRILLLDEPLTALDALLRDRLRVEIDALLRGLGITAVYVTHDQAEAMALGDRVVVMSHGRVAQIGTPREIWFKPADAFVADFIGTMNRVVGDCRGGSLLLPGGRVPWADGSDGPLELFFRPEAVEIVPKEEASLTGIITSSFFLGDRTRIIVAGVGSLPIVVESSNRREFREGEEVGLRIDPDQIIVLRT